MPTSTPPWPATSAGAAPTPGCAPPSKTLPRNWLERSRTMHFDSAFAELPKGLLHLVPTGSDATATEGLQRRSFLKLATVSGFVLGAFPLVACAKASEGLKPTQQPSAFVRIDRD